MDYDKCMNRLYSLPDSIVGCRRFNLVAEGTSSVVIMITDISNGSTTILK